MADENNALPSVYEYSEDVANQAPPPALPARTYPATCTGALPHQSKNKPENIILHLEFTIDPSAFPPDFPETEPQKIHSYRHVLNADTPRARFQLRKLCETMNVTASRKIDINDFIGKQVNLKLKSEPYNGEPRAAIDAIEPLR